MDVEGQLLKMEKPNLIPCLTFVGRGKANSVLEKVKLTKEELQEVIKEMKLKESAYESQPDSKRKLSMQAPSDEESDGENIDNAYGMEDYDNEPVDPLRNVAIENLILNNPSESDSEDSDADEDEFTVKPDDNLIITGHVVEDVSMLEVYVFNNENADFFLLHDIFLPSYPLCIQWLDFNSNAPENKGHYAAMGYMTNAIDIWDLNTTGSLEPAFQLGGKKTKKDKRHKDAVLDLSWNSKNRNVLASGSADNTVRLWDLKEQKSVLQLCTFEDKVQSVEFHMFETQNLLCGDYAGHVKLYDCRNPTAYKTWAFEKEIERVIWNTFNPLCYFASTNTGMIHYVDIRQGKPLWNLKAHDSEVTGVALSSGCPDMLVTGSQDESVKVWDLKDNTPQLVAVKDMKIGAICNLIACPDVPYVFCAGGMNKNNNLYLWDSRENDAVTDRFRDRHLVTYSTAPDADNNMDTPPEEKPTTSTATTEGRVRLKKKKSRKSVLTNRAAGAAESGEPQPGPSSESSSSAGPSGSQRRNKKDRKKMHPKTSK